ncbi:MAG: hypothetical protein OHK0023_27120 [Anaerolineae bacterium]
MANLIGQTVGQYALLELIGQGGMASVYRARQENMKRDVAIKVIESRLAQSPEFIARFEREAQLVASLNHPHILKVFDYGQAEGLVYLVMELHSGGSLAGLIRMRGRLTTKYAAQLTGQIASALDYAHKRGIIHRDLKPQNVLLDEQGNAILTDFGIAKLLQPDATALTQTGMVMGTPTYMAPEVWQGLTVDARADVYSLGIMLYEMLTGTPPYSAETPAGMMYQHLNEYPTPLYQRQPDVPQSIDQVINVAVAKVREQRFQTAGELSAALGVAMQGGTPTSLPRESFAATNPQAIAGQAPLQGGYTPTIAGQSAPTPIGMANPTQAQPRRGSGLIVAGGVAILALVAAIVGIALGSGGGAAGSLTETAVAVQPTDPPLTETSALNPSAAAIEPTDAPSSSTPSPADTIAPTETADLRTIAAQTANAIDLQTVQAATATQQAIQLATDIARELQSREQTRTAIAIASFTKTFTPTHTFTPTVTPTNTATFTESPTSTNTNTPEPTPTRTFTRTPRPTNTRAPSRTPRPTSTVDRVGTINAANTRIALQQPTQPPAVGRSGITPPVNGAVEVFFDASFSIRHDTDSNAETWPPTKSGSYKNVAMQARFFNPYASSQLWANAFRFRDTANAEWRFVFDSRKRWALTYVTRPNSSGAWDFNTVSSGSIANLITETNSSNLVLLVVENGIARFSVNGRLIATVDVSRYQAAGTADIIVGAYSNSERSGFGTRVEDFVIWRLPDAGSTTARATSTPRPTTASAAAPVAGARLVYGPRSRTFTSKDDGFITQFQSTQEVQDFAVRVTFSVPSKRPWSYGIFFRGTSNHNYRLILDSNGYMRLQYVTISPSDVVNVAYNRWTAIRTTSGTNEIELIVRGEIATVKINGIAYSRNLSVRHHVERGSLSAFIDAYNNYISVGNQIAITDFTVWSLD